MSEAKEFQGAGPEEDETPSGEGHDDGPARVSSRDQYSPLACVRERGEFCFVCRFLAKNRQSLPDPEQCVRKAPPEQQR